MKRVRGLTSKRMNQSQADRLRSMIEDEILTSQLKPGDRLDESRLAEKYGTSRTPVREALRQLSACGLIEIRLHKGAVVAKFGMRELIEMLEVMAELEGACGRLAAEACLNSDLNAIVRALDVCRRCVADNDVPGYKSANEAFHGAIYNASRNRHLIGMTLGMSRRLAAYRRLQLERVNSIKTSLEDHERIAFAIGDGFPEEADRLLRLHMLQVGSELRSLVSTVSTGDWEQAGNDEGEGKSVFRSGVSVK